MKNSFLSIFLAVSISCSLYPQQIKVTVNGSGNPIAGAAVRLLELDRTARTDDKGQAVFLNVPKGTYGIFVRVLGYASATNSVTLTASSAEATFDLKESAIGVEEVVVSASPYARTADDQYQSA